MYSPVVRQHTPSLFDKEEAKTLWHTTYGQFASAPEVTRGYRSGLYHQQRYSSQYSISNTVNVSLVIYHCVTRLPTPPSSFLHLMSLRTSNLLPPRPSIRRQSIAAHPRATNVSASSVTCYLWTYRRRYSRSVQDPKLLWQLEQARFDSSANLRDHEGYSRLFRGTVRFLFLSWYLLDPHKRWFKPHLYYLQVDVGPRIPH